MPANPCRRTTAAGIAAIIAQATDTYLLLRAFCDELARCGIAGAVTSPGSRSTPLVLSLVRDGRFPCLSQIDERSAGFTALGIAKASGRPAVVACTSGTAAANFLPAVIEAREARVPLIVLTADRPPELRDAGAGQTIDQIKLYGDAVKMFTEAGVHEATPQTLRWIRALACRAVWTSLSDRPGPVHLNFPLREPLVLDDDLPDDEPGGGGRPDGRPWVVRSPASRDASQGAASLAQIIRSAGRGVLVLGRWERAAGAAPLSAAAERVQRDDGLAGARRPAFGRAPRRAAQSRTTTRSCGGPSSPAPRSPRPSYAPATSRPRSRCASGSPRWTRSRC